MEAKHIPDCPRIAGSGFAGPRASYVARIALVER